MNAPAGRSRLALLAALFVLMWTPARARGQERPSGGRLGFDVVAGLLLSVPVQVGSDPCGSLFAVEGGVGFGVELTRHFVAESSLLVAQSIHAACSVDAPPPVVNGTSYHNVFPGGTHDEPMVTLSQRVAFEPLTQTRFAPRLLLGGGHLVGKKTWFWSAGMGIRLAPGAAPKVLEVERTHFRLHFFREVRTWKDGVVVERTTLSRERFTESFWAVRLRIPIGR